MFEEPKKEASALSGSPRHGQVGVDALAVISITHLPASVNPWRVFVVCASKVLLLSNDVHIARKVGYLN